MMGQYEKARVHCEKRRKYDPNPSAWKANIHQFLSIAKDTEQEELVLNALQKAGCEL
jgi:hypothetical protein